MIAKVFFKTIQFFLNKITVKTANFARALSINIDFAIFKGKNLRKQNSRVKWSSKSTMKIIVKLILRKTICSQLRYLSFFDDQCVVWFKLCKTMFFEGYRNRGTASYWCKGTSQHSFQTRQSFYVVRNCFLVDKYEEMWS